MYSFAQYGHHHSVGAIKKGENKTLRPEIPIFVQNYESLEKAKQSDKNS